MMRNPFTSDIRFRVGIHKPGFEVVNLRERDWLLELGQMEGGGPVDNRNNFPEGDVQEKQAKWIYEIPNVFSFRGTTYIDSRWAGNRAKDPDSIVLPRHGGQSLLKVLKQQLSEESVEKMVKLLPESVRYALAANSTDPEELILLAHSCCRFVMDRENRPRGLRYIQTQNGRSRADIDDFELFETIANNPYLPDEYKEIMVLRPGIQGNSEIVGEFSEGTSHVFEYLRRNSYIPWGHYAANMAHDSIRYRTSELSLEDIKGLRHLYYQRIYTILAGKAGVDPGMRRKCFSREELESLRMTILEHGHRIDGHPATLWGWNFGYDISASGYRLHASHQMIHQQYAMAPETVVCASGNDDGCEMKSYCCGDLVADVVERYGREHGRDFFEDMLAAIRNNRRTDGAEGQERLIVWEDDHVMLFVPKAQVSQWELQLLVTASAPTGPVGNVLETDGPVRDSLDRGILLAQRIYAELGAKMVTTVEFSKRIGKKIPQRLLYSFLPKLPWSMGAFSEAQLRFICGHFPEDFAIAARNALKRIDDLQDI